MSRRLLLLLAASWAWPSGGFAQEPATPERETEADRDSAVLESVLEDLLSYPRSPFIGRSRAPTEKRILFSPDPLTRRLEISDFRGQPISKKQEALEDLKRRVNEMDSAKGLELKDPRIITWDKIRDDAARDPRGRYYYRPQVFRAYRPGYSRDRQVAIVRFTYPRGRHSGDGTYRLARKAGNWVVLDRVFFESF